MLARAEFLYGTLATVAAAAAGRPLAARVADTALDRYIAKATPEYGFSVVKTIESGATRMRVVSMISQQWRSKAEVDRPLWHHWLSIIEPKHIKTNICLLVVSGGSTSDEAPHGVSSVATEVVARTGAVVAELHAVPNQPLRFSDENSARSEDDIIAYSWNKFLRTGDDEWPLRLPMTKSVVRAMDTITALFTPSRNKPIVDRFIVGGTSKRGWTTWLTPVVDPRVVAIVPVVIDTLNVEAIAAHEYRVYGFWPSALEPYEKMGIMSWLGTPQFDALVHIEDPYSYRERITVPKLIVNATGDQYFTPDSSRFYYNGLLGEKYLRYVPNTDHSLKGATRSAAETGKAFVDSIINGAPRPRYDWSMPAEGGIRVQTADKPVAVKLWQALNPDARDFRLETIGNGFVPSDLRDEGGHSYFANVARPARGFTAYFIELTYSTLHGDLFTVTSGVRVTPDVLPYRLPHRLAHSDTL
jgi:PhoPQ-activated pathogenicity-related protein